MADYMLRPAEPGDVAAMSALWAQKAALMRQLDRRYRAAYRDHAHCEASLLADLADSQRRVITAWNRERLVGQIVGALDGPEQAVVLDLTTELHTSQSGIGRQLYAHLSPWFVAHGVRQITLPHVAAWAVEDAFWRAMGAEVNSGVYGITL